MDKSKREILIIDDSATNIFLVESILNEYGYKTFSVLNAKEALKRIEKVVPDIILLDLLMPQISGFDFIKTIKQNPKFQSISVIIVSALTDDESVNEIMNLGATDFINKPIIIPQLIEKIESVLENRK